MQKDTSPSQTTLPFTLEIDWSRVPVVDDRAAMRAVIQQYIATRPDAECIKYVEGFMVESLTNFITDSVEKFIAGQKEHGGDFREIDFKMEAKKERIDAFWYSEGETWRKN